MVTRRQFVHTTATLALLGRIDPRAGWALALGAGGRRASLNAVNAVSRHVDVFVGNGGHGHTYPDATVPWGMVQISAGTDHYGWDTCSRYHHADGSIMGFSHTRFLRARPNFWSRS